MARPTRYNKEKHCKLAALVAPKGFIDKEIADIFDISERTLNYWKEKYPEFLQSLNAGKEIANELVERALFERATGYEHPAIKILKDKSDNIIKVDYIERYPPDPTSMIFFLKNRMPDKWRDIRQTELTGKDGKPVEYKNLTDQDLDAEIAKAEQQLANNKPGKSQKKK